jgi:hypothetical protein
VEPGISPAPEELSRIARQSLMRSELQLQSVIMTAAIQPDAAA